ncbi:hypothetical protein DdX_22327 [Ditylenchus destructor]|uniref:Uncharacterized protein n=1 Tax=Ditylenchus destructor TaxID=166010 RepID=A0AAD4MF01_9BILA|nr:hypothetical protein DdX_22327 [Ditylenchus destructor]
MATFWQKMAIFGPKIERSVKIPGNLFSPATEEQNGISHASKGVTLRKLGHGMNMRVHATKLVRVDRNCSITRTQLQISDELSDAIRWDCLRKQVTSSIGLYECEMETSWAMAVVSANLEVLCDAISVTDQHLLTSRECILPVLKTLSKTVPQESVFVMHRSCLTEECAKYPMEDIGYSYYHDFAIIQLRSVPNPDIIPVCFLSSDGVGQLDKHEDGHARQLRAYDKILTLVKQSDFEIENQATKCFSLLNKRAPSSSLAGFAGLAVGIAWTSLLGNFASPDFAPYSSSDDANARGTFPGSFNSVKHRRFKLLFHGSSTLGSDGSILQHPQSSTEEMSH